MPRRPVHIGSGCLCGKGSGRPPAGAASAAGSGPRSGRRRRRRIGLALLLLALLLRCQRRRRLSSMSRSLSLSAISSIDATEPGVVSVLRADLKTGDHGMRCEGGVAAALAGVMTTCGVSPPVASTRGPAASEAASASSSGALGPVWAPPARPAPTGSIGGDVAWLPLRLALRSERLALGQKRKTGRSPGSHGGK